ncbi:MarC family protein [Methanomassiliicoccus luminyensis]|jgi:multiple antibiotic resistance protein|uniref:MarC family protein n=1 Tax=Methanomassiliicoccus luminyensis TaxID=1080712 RepID=UPI000378F550|nr:MarC family protein [Methanomassiliicoccus luminyensis]
MSLLDPGLLDLNGLFYAATLLFFVYDPFASLPVFMALTKGYDEATTRRSANRAILVSGVLLLIFVLIGQQLLSAFGITIDGFRVAGGLVLLLMSMEIIFGLNLIRSSDQNVAWVIIATPILTGPGVITTAIILTVQYGAITVLLAASFSLIITWFLLRNAYQVVKRVGTQVIDIFSKVVGLLIAAMAIEYMFRGASQWFALYGAQSILVAMGLS